MFTILPGLLALGLVFRYNEQIQAKEKNISFMDFLWAGLLLFSIIIFIYTYSAGTDSFIHQVPYLIPAFYRASPSLFSFLLWNSFFLIIISSIFVYQSAARIGLDKKHSAGMISSMVVAFMMGLILLETPFMQNLESLSIDLRYTLLRNPEKKEHQGGINYCQPPYDATGEKQSFIAPTPPGVRDDIVIIGVSNKTIEELHGNWPLDWQIYATLADRMSNAKNNILLYDISFLDDKGIYGGNYCGSKFNCTPIGNEPVRRQIDILSDSFSNAKNTVLSDFPLETTDEARSSILNYDKRMDLLKSKYRLKHVKNGAYATVWASLPLPPVEQVTKNLSGIGYANVLKNDQGMNRWMPLVVRIVNDDKYGKPGYNPDVDDDFYPNIDIIVAARYYGIDPVEDIEVDWLEGYILLKNIPLRTISKINQEKFELEEVDIMAKPNDERNIRIPIDRKGLMNINFRGGRYCFKFDELLETSRMTVEQASQNYENKILLVAMYYATGVGTAKDIHLSPYGDMAGIEHHAYAINTILNQDFTKDVTPIINLIILLIVGLLMGFYQPRIPTWLSFILALGIAIAFSIITLYITFSIYSIQHVFPTVIVEQLLIFVSFIGIRVLTEEENVKFIRNTFSKFVSSDVVDELLTNPDAIALGGAKKEVSVFFSDVRGFTTISEALGPEDLVHLLNEYLTEMTELIIEYRGTIDKYMGDAIMAFWGAPAENDDHAYYACVASISQYKALQELQKKWSERNIPVLDIGIGINTGPAVVGNMGSSRRMDYTLMGDTVNLGSRLEGITKQYGVKICISEYTYERVKSRVYARELDLVRVKGKLEPVRIYELMGLKDDGDIEKYKHQPRIVKAD
ncbi:MAG: adenylate/guanylate cyclase domain-containing protein [Spirochaetia bacterium]|nr:adenylate/guanylate cyclase domain-containing protein [Spirochaetia bacterium]